MIRALLIIAIALPAIAGTSEQGPRTTKGIQPSVAVPTQSMIDSGRVVYVAFATALAVGTSETAVSLFPSRAFAIAASAISQVVTAGKTLRLQAMTASWTKGTGGGIYGAAHLRAAASGACSATSPLVWTVDISSSPAPSAFPDGIELSGNNTFCISHIETATNGSPTLEFNLVGFEY